MTTVKRVVKGTALSICLIWLTACSSILRDPVPDGVFDQTSVLGRQDLRFWADFEDKRHRVIKEKEPDALRATFGGIMNTEHHYLAVSGGGAEGAYGAGVLVGWSKLGTRPEFTMVTGVSTGALTAPFAFLGEEYDVQLKTVYTTLDTSRVLFRRSIFSIIRGDSMADNTPLLHLLEEYVDDEMIAAIAREYRKGRSLFIATTNLDAGRGVIWNIGRIADTGHPDARSLVHQIMLASAAIPGVFPPAYIKVQSPDGRTYDEMHVDGGTSSQMFLYPARLDWAELMQILQVEGVPTAYVIRNSRLEEEYRPVRARLANIAARSVSTLIRTQGVGDAFRIAALANRDGVDLNLTWIPAEAPENPGSEIFDPQYMSKLFDYGYQRVTEGSVWTTVDLAHLPSQQVEGF